MSDFEDLNSERIELITKEAASGLTNEEESKLSRLQGEFERLSDQLFDPGVLSREQLIDKFESEPLERLVEYRQTGEAAFIHPETGKITSAFTLGPPAVCVWTIEHGAGFFFVLYHPSLGGPIFSEEHKD